MTENKPIVLVVDDSFANRALLRKILSAEYCVEQAEDGMQALQKLNTLSDVAAVILDIRMPVLDGFGVLDAMNADERLKNIPVVVDTGIDDVDSQIKALDCGAMDVLIKPFNSQIALHRIRNIITRRETDRQAARNTMLEELLRQSEIDDKTGLYTKQGFCRKTSELLHANPDKKFILLRGDIDRFKVFNDVFGVDAGDRLLKQIGDICNHSQKPNATYGHWEADHFVVCMPEEHFDSVFIARRIEQIMEGLHEDFEFVARLGVYEVDNPELDVTLMCDRAFLALRFIKYSYTQKIAYYDDSMRASLLEEQKIVGEMDKALGRDEFVIYMQPQYNYDTGTLHGAEALVRWKHPQRGLIPPFKFIPVFERNGFISKLDEYVWEQVCIFQRNQLNAKQPVVPVSVNISRRDIYNPHLCSIFENLIQKYNLPTSLLRLEITESAYMENAEQLIKMVDQLRAVGFAVEMDDFGSGYSSLNTLKEVPVDMLKLDMKFLEDETDGTKGGSILTSVIRMAHWINLPVLAEGVETHEQADYLKSIGCYYMQGYYFAKPMPADEFRELLSKMTLFDNTEAAIQEDIQGAVDFLSASTQSTLLFNSFVGGAAILEYDGNNLEALRTNDKYFDVLGTTREAYADKQRHLLERLDEENRSIMVEALNKAIGTGMEVSCELRSLPLSKNGGDIWLKAGMRLLAKKEDRNILYFSIENITRRMRLTEKLTSIMNNVPCGILQFSENNDEEGMSGLVGFNDTAWKIYGYENKEEYVEAFHGRSKYKDIYPEDLCEVKKCIERIHQEEVGKQISTDHRIVRPDGSICWINAVFQRVHYGSGEKVIQVVFTDISEQKKADLQRLSNAFYGLYDEVYEFDIEENICFKRSSRKADDVSLGILAPFDRYLKVLCEKHACADEKQKILDFYYHAEKSQNSNPITLEYRYIDNTGSMRWASATILHLEKSTYLTCNKDITKQKTADLTARGNEKHQETAPNAREQKNKAFLEDRNNLEHYANTLFGLFDEIYELNFDKNTFFPLLTICSHQKEKKEYKNLLEALKYWVETFVCKDDRTGVVLFFNRENIEKIFTEQDKAYIEYSVQLRDGTQHSCRSTLLQLEGKRYLCCNKDITEQKKAAQLQQEVAFLKKQAEAQERYRIVVEQTGTAVVEMNYETGVFSCSEAYGKYETSRYSQEDMFVRNGDRGLIHPDDKEVLEKFLAKVREGASHADTLLRMKMADGSFRWTRMAGTYIRDENGEIQKAIGTFTDVDDEVRSKKALEQISERMTQIIANIPTGVVIYEMGEKMLPVYVSDKTCQMFGFTREEYDLRILNGEAISYVPDLTRLSDEDRRNLSSGQPIVIEKFRAIRTDGSHFWLRAFCSLGKNRDGIQLCYAVLADITAEISLEQKYMWQAEKYKILSESADMITFDYLPQEDTMRLTLVLPDRGLTEEMQEQYLEKIDSNRRIANNQKDRLKEGLLKVSRTISSGTFDFQGDYYQTGMRWYRAKYASLSDENGNICHVIGRLDDIDDMILEKKQLQKNAQVDKLTGVYNKNYAVTAIKSALENRDIDGPAVALFMDIDNFKELNDTYGHLEADIVLQKIGRILKKAFRKEDIVARFGGDEFIIYMKATEDLDCAAKKAEEVIKQINRIQVKEEMPVQCCIGITRVEEKNTYDSLLKAADTALYEAKRNGKNRYVIVDKHAGDLT